MIESKENHFSYEPPFSVVSREVNGYLAEFENNSKVDFVPEPKGEIAFSPINERDKWTGDCQCCIAALVQGRSLDDSKMLSVLFHIDPSSVDWFGFLNQWPYFKTEYPRIMKQLRDETVKGTRTVSIAGGFVGEYSGKVPGLNRYFYNKMVSEVNKISKKMGFPESLILQPPKQEIAYTDVYWAVQEERLTITTRPDNSQ